MKVKVCSAPTFRPALEQLNRPFKPLEGMGELEKCDFHRRLNGLISGRLEWQSMSEDSLAMRTARWLIRLCGTVNYIDLNDKKISNKNRVGYTYSWQAKLIRFFIFYFTLKLFVAILFLNRFDMIWFKLQEQLSNCTGVDLNGSFVRDMPAAGLLLNGDPTRNTLRLGGAHQVVARNYSMFKPGQFECAPSERSSELPIGTLTDASIAASQRELGEYRNLVKLVGVTQLNFTFTAEFIVAFLLIYTFIIYGCMSVLTTNCQNLDYSILRKLLDSRRDLSDIIESMRREANTLIWSSRRYTRIFLENLTVASRKQRNASGLGGRIAASDLKRKEMAYRIRHMRSVRYIKRLAQSGQLLPKNRTRASIERDMTRFNYSTIILNIEIQALALFLTHVILHLDLLRPSYPIYYELDFMDIFTYVEFSIFMALVPVIFTFYISYALVGCLDQMTYAGELRQSLRECSSKIEYGWATRDFNSKISSIVDCPKVERVDKLSIELRQFQQHSNSMDLELELLRVFLEYRIFFEQSKGIRRSLSPVCSVILLTIATPPLLVHIYYDYLLVEVRDIIALCSCLLSLAADLLLLPVCRLNFSCQAIHRELYKLTARAVQSMATVGNGNIDCQEQAEICDLDELMCLSKHDNHIVWLLRKQLTDPEMAISNFSVNIFNFKFSYQNLIRLHFWYGLITLPTVVLDSQSANGVRIWLGIL